MVWQLSHKPTEKDLENAARYGFAPPSRIFFALGQGGGPLDLIGADEPVRTLTPGPSTNFTLAGAVTAAAKIVLIERSFASLKGMRLSRATGQPTVSPVA